MLVNSKNIPEHEDLGLYPIAIWPMNTKDINKFGKELITICQQVLNENFHNMNMEEIKQKVTYMKKSFDDNDTTYWFEHREVRKFPKDDEELVMNSLIVLKEFRDIGIRLDVTRSLNKDSVLMKINDTRSYDKINNDKCNTPPDTRICMILKIDEDRITPMVLEKYEKFIYLDTYTERYATKDQLIGLEVLRSQSTSYQSEIKANYYGKKIKL